jgi:hypothetical protein
MATGSPKVAKAFVEGKGWIQSSEVLAMWIEQQPERIVFHGLDSGGNFRPSQMPANSEITVRGNAGPLGKVKKTNDQYGMRLTPTKKR